jgi:hypothetical protein
MIDKDPNNQEQVYHYNREEFKNSRFSESKSYKGGAFKRNRTLLITLLDISVIVLIILVVLPFVRKANEIPDLNGYRLSFTQSSSGNEIFFNLSITNKSKGESKGADLADIEFFLKNSSESVFINDLLPLPGKSLTYRASLTNDGSELASVKVTIKDTTSVLNLKLNKSQN